MSTSEVWITGLGALTAVGADTSALARALLGGCSGLKPMPAVSGTSAGIVQEVPRDRLARRLDRSASLFLAAAAEAWCSAGLDAESLNAGRCAVTEGSSLGSMSELLDTASAYAGAESDTARVAPEGATQAIVHSKARPSALLRFMSGAGGAAFAQAHGITGPVLHISAGSVSAACAIGEAFRWIAGGRADVVVAGGAECPLNPGIVEHFRAAGILADRTDTERPCRPFDTTRMGTVLGEGAGVLVLESNDHAWRRGAEPRAVLRGYGLSCETYSMFAPDPNGVGVTAAAEQALRVSGRCRVGWIKTHGTGTRQNDAAECRGLAELFGSDLRHTPLTALKPLLGHCLGASGSVETVASVLALDEHIVPPSLGTKRVDPELPSCTVVMQTQESHAEDILLLAESFGGRCAALLIGRA